MWSALLGYPATPPMPAGAMPVLSRLAITRAEGLHAWEGVWRMGVDAGRTEGLLIGFAAGVASTLAALAVVLLLVLTVSFLVWLLFLRKRAA